MPIVNEGSDVAHGRYQDLPLTKEFSAVEPGVREYEWRARLAGEVRAITVWVGSDRQEPEQYSPLE